MRRATPLRVLAYEPYPFGQNLGNIRTLLGILQYAPFSSVYCVVAAPFDSELSDRVRELGSEWVVVPTPSSVGRYGGQVLGDSLVGRVKTIWNLLWYNRQLYRLLKRRRIDIVYCNSIRSLLTVGIAAMLAGVPRVWYVKGELQNGFLDRLGFLIANRILFFCAPNRDDRYPWLVKLCARKIDLVNIGLDLDDIARAESLPSSIDAELERRGGVGIGYLGQMCPAKGVHVLVDAFARVAPRFPDATLYLFGDPIIEEFEPYMEELRQQVRRLGIEDRVVFAGWRADAFAVVNRMTVMVHPSFSEGFGLAVLEPMAMGKPVIATRVGGLREAVRDGVNGFLVEPGDGDAMAARLDQLLADPALRGRLGEAARDTTCAEYALEDKMHQLYAIWYDVAGERPPASLRSANAW